MIAFVADEDFHGAITRGLRRRGIDVERVQDLDLAGAADEHVLAWAASVGRVILTHDRATLLAVAYARIRAGMPMAGVIAAVQSLSIGAAIDDLELVATCSEPDDWHHRVEYLPLR